jgi:hypothetical protein
MTRSLDRPEPSYFALRLAPHTPWVPAVIFSPCPFVWPDETDWPYHPDDWGYPCDRQPYPIAVKIGEMIHWKSALVLGVWQRGEPIKREAYEFLMARREWCRKYAPASAEAAPAVIKEWRGRKRWEI